MSSTHPSPIQPGGRPYAGRSRPWYRVRLFRQLAGSLLLFLIVLVMAPVGSYGELARSYLVAEEYDFFPRVRAWFDTALWVDTYDKWVFRETAPEAVPASAAAGGFIPPVPGDIVQRFGWRSSPVDDRQFFHGGVDIKAPAGAPVQAASSGYVTRVYQDPGLGQVVEIEVQPKITVIYGNCEPAVAVGDAVRQGEVVGRVADESRPLHWEVHENGVPVDPLDFQ